MIKKLLLLVLKFYQKFLTILSFGSCRYYPTCSHYAKLQFEHNNMLLAFYYSTLRVLRCNQLFEGGFDYPQIKKDLKNVQYKKIDVKYWFIPTKKDNYLIIQSQDFKHGN